MAAVAPRAPREPGRRPSPYPRREQPVADGDRSTPEAAPSAARLLRLLDAHRTITADLSLGDMLGRIVTAACDLVGARYGALGVIAHDGTLEQLVHHGIDEETVQRIGRLPTGKGLLAALIADPRPVRVPDVASDERSGGFPPHHPTMRAFLGVPIRVRGEVFGDLYLAEPANGTFSAEDEDIVTGLAATAGTAIANARHYDDARRSRDWLRASGDIARALLSDTDTDTLGEILSRAREVAEADLGALVLPDAEGRRLAIAVVDGVGADRFRGSTVEPDLSALTRAIAAGRPVVEPDVSTVLSARFQNHEHLGAVMSAPLIDATGVRGAVVLLRESRRPTFTEQDLELLTSYAQQVALALEMDEARSDAEQLRVLEVRQQLAEDLHDNVIQRLFATGMGLQGLAKSAVPAALSERLGRHITDLDETIDEIRERVFGLRESAVGNAQRVRGRFPRDAGDTGDTEDSGDPASP